MLLREHQMGGAVNAARQTGAQAFEQAQASAKLSDAKTLAGTDEAASDRLSGLEPAGVAGSGTRRVGGRLFVQRGRVWTDVGHTGRITITAVAAYSRAYFDLVRLLPEVAPYLSAGEEILIAGAGRAFASPRRASKFGDRDSWLTWSVTSEAHDSGPDPALPGILSLACPDALSPDRRSGSGRRSGARDVRPRRGRAAEQSAAVAVCRGAQSGARRWPSRVATGTPPRAAPVRRLARRRDRRPTSSGMNAQLRCAPPWPRWETGIARRSC